MAGYTASMSFGGVTKELVSAAKVCCIDYKYGCRCYKAYLQWADD